MYYRFELSTIPRKVAFPYPVKYMGSVEGDSSGGAEISPTHYDQLEIGLRLSDSTETAVDRIDGREYRTPLPHVCLRYPNTVWRYRYDDRHTVFFAYAKETCEAMRRAGILPEGPIWRFELTPEIRMQTQALREMQFHLLESNVIDRIDLACFRLLQELVYQHQTAIAPPLPERDRILKIASLLRFYFQRPVDLDELARQNGLSRRSFFRHWAACFPVTPSHYLLGLRLEEAARRLRETDEEIGVLALRSGFTDASYFARVFRREFGSPPNRYRLQHPKRP